MSKERLINALEGLGFSKSDTLVYVFLAKNGPCILPKIAEDLGLEESVIEGSLRELQSIGVVSHSIEKPIEFVALPFDELIDLFVEVKKEQAKTRIEKKDKLLLDWKTMLKKDSIK